METFPNIQLPDVPFRFKWDDEGMLFDPQDGPPISSRKKTRSYITMYPEWVSLQLSTTDYATLETFLNETIYGSSIEFNYTHPITHDNYIVRCIDKGEWRYAVDGHLNYSGSITLRGYKSA